MSGINLLRSECKVVVQESWVNMKIVRLVFFSFLSVWGRFVFEEARDEVKMLKLLVRSVYLPFKDC